MLLQISRLLSVKIAVTVLKSWISSEDKALVTND